MLKGTLERLQRTYDDLAKRGEHVVAGWRGQDEPEQSGVVVDLGDAKPGAILAHDELPLKDYDHLTLGSLRARLAKLDIIELTQIRDYERVHANRLNVMTMLDNRIAKMTSA